MNIKQQLQEQKIAQLQLDPYGICNAKCWFCPVKYRGNPKSGKEVMDVDLLEKIISDIIDERGRLVHPNFNGFYTAHYNEVLLYPHFEDLLRIAQKYNLMFMVLSNGIPLSPEKTDLIAKYNGVVNGICLNIPAFEPELWSKRAGVSVKQFDRLISNIRYAMDKLPHFVTRKLLSIQVNGADDNSFMGRGGALEKGPDFPEMDLHPIWGELNNQEELAKELFPGLHVFSCSHLIDRAGLLDRVMTNKPAIAQTVSRSRGKVVGCANGDSGGRPIGWLHVNSAGKAFLCCNDYDMSIIIGDFKTQKLRDFWGTDEHVATIEQSYNTICRNCASAKYEIGNEGC